MQGLFDKKKKVRHPEDEATCLKVLCQEGAGPGIGSERGRNWPRIIPQISD